jgi:hypothetical protein
VSEQRAQGHQGFRVSASGLSHVLVAAQPWLLLDMVVRGLWTVSTYTHAAAEQPVSLQADLRLRLRCGGGAVGAQGDSRNRVEIVSPAQPWLLLDMGVRGPGTVSEQRRMGTGWFWF